MNVQPFVVANTFKCEGGKDVLLGRGSFADVYLGYEISTRRKVYFQYSF